MAFFYHTNSVKKSRLILIVFFALISFFVTSCVSGKSKNVKKTFRKGKQTIRIIRKGVDNLYLSKKKLDHPQTFTEAQILETLKSFKYKRLALFSNEEDVFDNKLANEISPLLSKAFQKASGKDFIEIDVRSRRGRTFCDVFVYKNKINWKFKTVNGASYEKNNSRDYLDGWKLVLQKNQKYHGEKELLGVRVSKNWVVSPVDKIISSAGFSFKDNQNTESDNSDTGISETLLREQPKKDAPLTQEEIEAKFHRLKNLMRKGLITREEYTAKKQKLLEKYFQ